MLPGEDGNRLLNRLRQEPRTRRLPVIMVTARGAEMDKVQGLDGGADDYIVKPFGVMELLSRVRAVLRRARDEQPQDELAAGSLRMDVARHRVFAHGRDVTLTHMEFELLRYLMDNEGRVLSKAQILDHVWQYDWGGDAAIVESYISYLRKKVDGIMVTDENGEQHKVAPLIETKRGIGYMIRAPKTVQGA